MSRIFILSPARTTGKRGELLFDQRASFDLARRLHGGADVTLGEAFSFLSGLYFRGKLAYASRFAQPPEDAMGCFVITSNLGLMPCMQPVTLPQLRQFADTPIDIADENYRRPLQQTAVSLKRALGPDVQAVLLGSIATDKFVGILREVFAERLVFPRDFIGRGDMSRGGLLLRAVDAGTELEYVSLSTVASRTGTRPPRLAPTRGTAPRLKE